MSWQIAADIREMFVEVVATKDSQTFRARTLNRKDQLLSGLAEALNLISNHGDPSSGSPLPLLLNEATLTLTTDLERVALREHWGGPAAFLTTEGFENLLEIGDERRLESFGLQAQRARPLIPRDLSFGVTERTTANGIIEIGMDDKEIDFVISKLELAGVKSVAIGFLHSNANPTHEKQLVEKLKEKGYTVFASHEFPGNERERSARAVEKAFASSGNQTFLADIQKLGFVPNHVHLTTTSAPPAPGILRCDFLEDRVVARWREKDSEKSVELAYSPLNQVFLDEGGLVHLGLKIDSEPGPVVLGKGIHLCILDLLAYRSKISVPQGTRLKIDTGRVLKLLAPMAKQLRLDPDTCAQKFINLAHDLLALELRHHLGVTEARTLKMEAGGWLATLMGPPLARRLGVGQFQIRHESPWSRAQDLKEGPKPSADGHVWGNFTFEQENFSEDEGSASEIRSRSSERVVDPFEKEWVRCSLRKIIETLTQPQNLWLEIHGALLDSRGDLMDADGPNSLHFPSLETCAKNAKKYIPLKYGDTIITNDPYSGNTRLCDLFLLQGAFGRQQANELRYYVAVQVAVPGLLNKNPDRVFTSVEDEGFRIPPTLLDQGGSLNGEILTYLSQSGVTKDELTEILNKAKAALKKAATELIALEQKMGRDKFQNILDDLKKYSESMMRRALHEIPDGDYLAHDIMDNDGVDSPSLRVQCQLTAHGENVLLSFMGTAKQTRGPINCNYAMTLGACFWVLRSLVKTPIPINAGAFQAFSIEAPDGTLVNARYPSALLAGYFETSKRIVDVLFLLLNKALPSLMPCQSGGSSNATLMTFGKKFYLDTLGSGGGATKTQAGTDGIMTTLHNRACPSVEELEKNYPLQVTQAGFRPSSGGDGKCDGGSGLTRAYKFLAPAKIMLLSDRRMAKARGLFGGVSGLGGEFWLISKDGEKKKISGEKMVLEISAGDRLVVNTPGGGGWGKKEEPEV